MRTLSMSPISAPRHGEAASYLVMEYLEDVLWPIAVGPAVSTGKRNALDRVTRLAVTLGRSRPPSPRPTRSRHRLHLRAQCSARRSQTDGRAGNQVECTNPSGLTRRARTVSAATETVAPCDRAFAVGVGLWCCRWRFIRGRPTGGTAISGPLRQKRLVEQCFTFSSVRNATSPTL
jgi:hypothetical protein